MTKLKNSPFLKQIKTIIWEALFAVGFPSMNLTDAIKNIRLVFISFTEE